MLRYSAAALALLLAGCATTSPGIKVQRVEVPVPQPCVARADLPPEPAPVGDKLTGNAAADALLLGQSAIELRLWGRGLFAALEACAG